MDTPFRVYGSMQDHASFRGTVDFAAGRDRIATADFQGAPGGEGSTHAIDPTNLNIVYSSGSYGTLHRRDLSRPLSASLNGRAGISAEMATRLSLAFNTIAESWLNQWLQQDLWQAERNRKSLHVRKLVAA